MSPDQRIISTQLSQLVIPNETCRSFSEANSSDSESHIKSTAKLELVLSRISQSTDPKDRRLSKLLYARTLTKTELFARLKAGVNEAPDEDSAGESQTRGF